MNLVEALLSRIAEKRKRIVVIGDVIVDRWIHGHLVPCQDGCQKFIQDGPTVITPGGAANAERSISNWNINMSRYGVSLKDCCTKTRYVENGKIVFREDNELFIPASYERDHKEALEMVDRAGGVLLSDYDKGFLTPEFIKQVAAMCRERRVPCVADCKRAPEVYEGCILKANLEWSVNKNKGFVPDMTTRGMTPPLTKEDGVVCGWLPDVPCVNHVGAGDCFAAHLTLALAYGFSLKDAAALAHSAGRVYVQHPHNRPPMPAEIDADMSTGV